MPFTDSFTEASVVSLTAHDARWILVGTGLINIAPATDQAVYASGTFFGYYFNETFATKHYSKLKSIISDNFGLGPAIRVQSSAVSFYYATLYQTNVYTGEMVDGSPTDWDAGIAVADGSIVELWVDADTEGTIILKDDGSVAHTYTEKTALNGGRPGIHSQNAGYGDDWEGGDVAGASGAIQGLIAGVCSTAARLLGAGALAGLLAGSGAASAQLTSGPGAIQGYISGVSTAGASLGGTGVLQGAIAGTSTASAYFPATTVALGGTVNCVSTADAKIQAQTGAKFPRTAGTQAVDPWLDEDWVGAGNITADDNVMARVTAASFDSPDQTYVLKGYNFDFSGIPDGASIQGVSAGLNAWWAVTKANVDLMQLLSTGNAVVGTNQCSGAGVIGLTTATGDVYGKGGAADLWGNALDAAWVKNSSFGLGLGVSATGANCDVFVDYATLEVFYSPAVYGYRSAAAIGIGSMSAGMWGQGDIRGFSPGLAAIWAEVYATGKLQGAIASSPTITADLTGSAPGVLAGAIAGTSTASAQQSATGALGVTTTGGFTLVIAGGGTTYAVAGAIAGTGTANAQAKGTGNIQILSAGVGTATAQISGSGKLEGYAPGTGAQTAQITAVLPGDIRAYVPGSGTASAIIIYSGGCLGTISGTSSVGANLAQLDPASAIRRRIWLGYIFSPTPAPGGTSAQDRYEWLALPYENATAAYAAGTSTVNGQIFGTGNIAAAVAGTSTCAAAVSASTGCQAASIGIATATAGLLGTGNVQGAVAGTGAATSLLGGTFPIQAVSVGLGTASSYLVSSVAIQAASAGTGAANAQIIATGRLQSASAGIATVSAGPTATGALAATSAGVGTLNAQMVGTGAIRGAAAGVGSNTAAITGLAPGQAMGAVAGIGTANANLKGTGAMRAYAAGVGTCSQKPGAAAAAHFGGFGTLFQLHKKHQRIFG